MKSLSTQVAIVGAGPAGLMLSHLLHRRGIESIVLENRSRQYVEQRVRAGVLEQSSVDLLNQSGVGQRMQRDALVHHGIELRFGGGSHRIDLTQLSGGRSITVYGQQEVVKDLIRARLDAGGEILFDVEAVRPLDFTTDSPRIAFVCDGEPTELRCEFIAGCDGSHGVCRPAIPAGALTFYERSYPFAWLGILARAKPASHELIYAYHERGFALLSMRSPEVSRLYLQVAPDEDIEQWPDARIWDELRQRLETVDGFRLAEGPVMEKSVTGLRSFVAEPMRHERMFLAGDAAHIVPPTGAKGMNLALADVHVLSIALDRYFDSGRDDLLESYSATCLKRVWRAEHFSYWMTSMLHRAPVDDAFTQKLQLSQLEYVVSSRAAATSLAENYVGLPLAGLEP
jgi:p-hydroxybenzoate 3-monooxygenase